MLKPLAADEGSGALRGILVVGSGRIETPARALTAGEVRSAKATGNFPRMEGGLLIVGKLMSQETAEAAAREEEAWERFAAGVNQGARILPGSPRTLFLSQTEVVLEGIETLRAFLDLQALVGFEIVTVQYGSTPTPEEVLRAFDYARRWADRRGIVAPLMPVLPPQGDRQAARALMAALVERGATALGVDLRGGFPYQTLRAVEDLKESHPQVWVHAFQVPPRVRFGGARLPTAEPMVLPYFGVDTYSRHVVPPPPVPVVKEKINRFDPSGWGYLKWGEHAEAYGQGLRCNCPVCRGKDLKEFFEPGERQVLDLAKVHDHLAQAAEMSEAAKRIGGDGYASAMAEKRFARNFLGLVEGKGT
jgi:hypothetical protein